MLVSGIFSTGGGGCGHGCGGGCYGGGGYEHRSYGGGYRHHDYYESYHHEGHRRGRRDREEFLEIAGIGIL
jgi:hypothetical protein